MEDGKEISTLDQNKSYGFSQATGNGKNIMELTEEDILAL